MADSMEEWLLAGACDGFNLLFPFYPLPLNDFVDACGAGIAAARDFPVPSTKAARCGENIDVPIPPNRFAK